MEPLHDLNRENYYSMRGAVWGVMAAAYIIGQEEDDLLAWDIRLLNVKGLIRDGVLYEDPS